jgi:nucleoid-associated protein YgaU
MSVAVDFASVPASAPRSEPHLRPYLRPVRPERHAGAHPVEQRPGHGSRQLAAVHVLHAPAEPADALPLRLTRRGVVVVGIMVAALAVALVGWARASVPSAPQPVPASSVVTVRTGDTLWAIAARVAPQRDPRDEVAALQARNHLASVDLVPGQQLTVP